jgi:hypothetical protein
MSDNPYSAPRHSSSKDELGNFHQIYESLFVPAIALITTSLVWLCLLAISLATNLILLAAPGGGLLPGTDAARPGALALVWQIGWFVVLAGCNVVILMGGLRMRTLRSYGLCQLAAILAVIPCTGPCYLVGIPFGIWALIALNRPGVRDAFRP